MDCWDGPDGEPVIYHGWTLTSKILFKDVIAKGIKPYAFTASNYPLILSIENHCSKVQQDKMAEHFINILGDSLYRENVDYSLQNLPSPEFFKNKILIKAKKKKVPAISTRSFNSTKLRNSTTITDLYSLARAEDVNSFHNSPKILSNELEDNRLSILTKSRALSDIVNYTEAVKFKSFDEPRKFWEMSSFEETKVIQILNNETTKSKLTKYTERNLCRIYPKGSRLLSSNLSNYISIHSLKYQYSFLYVRTIIILGSRMSNGSNKFPAGIFVYIYLNFICI